MTLTLKVNSLSSVINKAFSHYKYQYDKIDFDFIKMNSQMCSLDTIIVLNLINYV